MTNKNLIEEFKKMQQADFENEQQDQQLKPLSWDDTGNADRFMRLYGDIVKFSYKAKKFFVYEKGVWSYDEKGDIFNMIDDVVDKIKLEPMPMAEDNDEKEQEKIQKSFNKFIQQSRSNRSKVALSKEIQHRMPIDTNDFDTDKFLLNVKNGYVDLETAELYDADKNKLFSKQCGFDFDETATPHKWLEFLDQIFNHDKELINYIQRAVGYTLSGSNEEQVAFFLYGDGRNGKSVFINTLKDILGSYAKSMSSKTIMVKNANSSANSDIARLQGARLVISSEPNDGSRLDEGLLKELTGGDTVTARFLYGDEFEFKPHFKLWLATNHKPIIRGTDSGIWRRLMLIPFEVQIPENQVDKNLSQKLMNEAEGILKWAVDGFLDWRENGLNPPEKIVDAGKEYRNEMDVITLFLYECTKKDETEQVKSSELYQHYKTWATQNTQYVMSSTRFGKEMLKHAKRKRTSQGNQYLGIKLVDDTYDVSGLNQVFN